MNARVSSGFRLAFFLLLTYLAGITIIGKGPTYLGYPPIFWGEIVMLLGLVFLVHGRPDHKWMRPKYDVLAALILLWMSVGAVRTAFSFPQWKLDALRDAAMWYYASFYFVGLGVATRTYWADRVWRAVKMFWVLAVCWGTANWMSQGRLSDSGPFLPWRGVTLFFNARDEVAQNTALGSVILLCFARTSRRWQALKPILLPLSLCGIAAFASSEGRAVKIAFAGAAVVALSLISSAQKPVDFSKRFGKVLLVLVPIVVALILAIPQFKDKMQLDRFGNNPQAEGTRKWRAIWWERLTHTVLTTNPAFGIGFGRSLHIYNPLIADRGEEWEVRSPHNFNMSVFTRMGLVGIFLFTAIIVLSFAQMYTQIWAGGIEGQRYSKERRGELTFWLFMLICTYVNSSMGVLMEGPVFGIWFWFALGFSRGRAASTGGPDVRELAGEVRREIQKLQITAVREDLLNQSPERVPLDA